MQLIEIADRAITISLDPEDALRIAQACTVATEQDLADEAAAHWYECFAAAFDAMALAAVKCSYMTGENEEMTTLSYQRAWMLRPQAERPEPQ